MLITASDDTMTFGAAVELAVAMPLSWLPLISDYTREAEKAVCSNTCQCACLQSGQHFYVHDRHGSGYFYR